MDQAQGQGQGQGPAANRQQGGGVLQMLSRIMMAYMAFQFIGKFIAQQQQAPLPQHSDNFQRPSAVQQMLGMDPAASIPKFATHDAEGNKLPPHRPIFRQNARVNLYVYLTEYEDFQHSRDGDQLLWKQHGIALNWEDTTERVFETNITVTPAMYNNQSVHAHVFFTLPSVAIEEAMNAYNKRAVAYQVFEVTKHRKKRKEKKLRSLLDDAAEKAAAEKQVDSASSTEETTEAPVEEQPIVLHWKPTLDLSIVLDVPAFARNTIPPQIAQHMNFHDSGDFFPVIYYNQFWMLTKHYIEINETVSTLPLKVSYSHIAFWKWHLQNQMEDQWKMQQRLGAGTEEETDVFRETIAETNPWLLGLTAVVSIFHMLFDFLAFKNDINFWKTRKSLEGLSVRTILVNCFFQLVILLYLFDNDTSWMILISSVIGFFIECWKITKVVKFTIVQNPDSPIPSLKWEVAESYGKNKTREYDEVAMTHLLYAVIPLVLGYACYSLVHSKHKSWYSWIVTSLTGFVYAFGFVTMTPQLFINYKLKSVAHMPWKAMVYKSLNTFIDDLFAFIIKMPILHRISCFRDDIIFFIYLYQRWKYPVDKSRVNEFGQGGEEASESEQPEAITETTAAPAAEAEPSTQEDNNDNDSDNGEENEQGGSAGTTTTPAAATSVHDID